MKFVTAVLLGILLIAHCGDRREEIVFEDTQAVPADTDNAGCIRGQFVYADIREAYGVDDRISDATVMLVGTHMGAMSDSDGSFLITNIPAGEYQIRIGHREFMATEFAVQVTAGDTLELGTIELFVDPFYGIDYYIWPKFETLRTIELEFIDADIPDSTLSCISFYTGSTCLPWERNGNTYLILSNEISTSILAGIPGYGVFRIPLPADSTPAVQITVNIDSVFSRSAYVEQTPILEHLPDFQHSTRHQWLSDEYSVEHRYFDISNWGMDELTNWGFRNFRVFSDGRILLVYHRYAVIIDMQGIITDVSFDFPVMQFYVSDNSRYLLVFESIGERLVGSRAQMIDLDAGSSIVFDPTPEKSSFDSGRGEMRLVFQDRISPPVFEITDSGRMVRIDRDSIHFYSSNCNVNAIANPREYLSQILNAKMLDRDELLMILGTNNSDDYSLIFFDMMGNFFRSIDLHENEDSCRCVIQSISPDANHIILSMITFPLSTITRLYNCNGNVLAEWNNLLANSIVFSESGYFFAIHSELDNPQLIVFDIKALEENLRIEDRYTRQYDHLSVIDSILDVSDRGDLLVLLRDDRGSDIQNRYAFLESNGDIVWMSSCFTNVPNRYWYHISDDGSVISFVEGQYIHQISFSRLN